MPKVFVYGTLRKGMHNEYLLQNSRFLGFGITEPSWTLFDLGAFPAIIPVGGSEVLGEVYQVDQATLAQLDQLEMCPTWYQRRLIQTDYGAAWIYYLEAVDSECQSVKSGDWVTYVQSRLSPQDLDWLISDRYEEQGSADDTQQLIRALGLAPSKNSDEY